jgi:hypothetical protein
MRKALFVGAALTFVALVVLSNWLTAEYGMVAGFVTAGTFTAGLTLAARDVVRESGGIWASLACVAAGAAASVVMASPALAIASGSGVHAVRTGRYGGVRAAAPSWQGASAGVVQRRRVGRRQHRLPLAGRIRHLAGRRRSGGGQVVHVRRTAAAGRGGWRVRYFATASGPRVREAMRCGLLDQITTPASQNLLEPGVAWCADNGIYSRAYPGDTQYLRWLSTLADSALCRFAVAPDVVADHGATLERSWPMLRRIRGLGLPVALCAQNGAEAGGPPSRPMPDGSRGRGVERRCRRCGHCRRGQAAR